MAYNASGWTSDTATETDPTPANEDETLAALECMFDPPVDAICPFGDIILVADDKHHPTRKIQVSSCVLSMVSPVFRALFSKNFAEGQSSAGEGPREIRLEETPYAVDLLCCLLHHKVPEYIDAELPVIDMLSLAILADKYDCVAALRWPVKGLFDKLSREATPAFLGYCRTKDFDLAVAAYILDQPEFFRDITKALVLHSNSITPRSFSSRCHDFIPPAAITTLSAQLRAAQNVFTHHVNVLLQTFCSNASYCNKQYLITPFMHSMTNLLAVDYNKSSSTLSQLLPQLKEVEIPPILMKNMYCNCSALTRKNFASPDYAGSVREAGRGLNRIGIRRDSGDVIYDNSKPSSPILRPQAAHEEWVWKSINGEPAGWHHLISCPHESAVDTTQIRIVEQHDVKDAVQNVRDIVQGLCLDCIRCNGESDDECRSGHVKPWLNQESGRTSPWDPPWLDIDCFGTEVVATTDGGWGSEYSYRVREAPSWWEKAW